MSTRVLRSKTTAGTAPSRIPIPTSHSKAKPGAAPETAEPSPRMYSDVVASRSPSPREENSERDSDDSPEPQPAEPVADAMNISDQEDHAGTPWITVERRQDPG
ncbi:hypothetical protein BYT27DRAFT_7216692 [Phlegmacium glaucopus]|nr:hypothetical protein BYT27DRAFT_7216692 [Phlegmacium glaucopus]